MRRRSDDTRTENGGILQRKHAPELSASPEHTKGSEGVEDEKTKNRLPNVADNNFSFGHATRVVYTLLAETV